MVGLVWGFGLGGCISSVSREGPNDCKVKTCPAYHSPQLTLIEYPAEFIRGSPPAFVDPWGYSDLIWGTLHHCWGFSSPRHLD